CVRLTPLLLHVWLVLSRRVAGRPAEDAVIALVELDLDLTAVVHPVLDGPPRLDARVRALEVEAGAPVLRLHARGEFPALAQVHGAARRVPVVRRGVPLLDVVRVVVDVPDLLQVRLHECLYGDLHECLLLGFAYGRTDRPGFDNARAKCHSRRPVTPSRRSPWA